MKVGDLIAGLRRERDDSSTGARKNVVFYLPDILGSGSVAYFCSPRGGLRPVSPVTLSRIGGRHYAVPISPEVWVSDAPPEEEGVVVVVDVYDKEKKTFFHSISEELLSSMADAIVKADKRAKVVSPLALYRELGDGLTVDLFVWSEVKAWLSFALLKKGDFVNYGVEVGTLERCLEALEEVLSSYRMELVGNDVRLGLVVADLASLEGIGDLSAQENVASFDEVERELKTLMPEDVKVLFKPYPWLAIPDPKKGPFFPHVSLKMQEAKKKKETAMAVILVALLGVTTFHGTRFVFVRHKRAEIEALTEEKKRLADEALKGIKKMIPYAASVLAAASQPQWSRVMDDLRRVMWIGDCLESFNVYRKKGRWLYQMRVSSKDPGRTMAYMKLAMPRTIFGKPKLSVVVEADGFSVVAKGALPKRFSGEGG